MYPHNKWCLYIVSVLLMSTAPISQVRKPRIRERFSNLAEVIQLISLRVKIRTKAVSLRSPNISRENLFFKSNGLMLNIKWKYFRAFRIGFFFFCLERSIFKFKSVEKAQLSMHFLSKMCALAIMKPLPAHRRGEDGRTALLPSQAFRKLNKTSLATITPVSYLCCSVNNEILIMYSESTKPLPWQLCFHVISLMNR